MMVAYWMPRMRGRRFGGGFGRFLTASGQTLSPSSGESTYAFLDRVAGPFWDRIRRLIEDWVNDYCPDDQAEMVGRLQSGIDINFTAAIGSCCLPRTEGTRIRGDLPSGGGRYNKATGLPRRG